MTISAFTMTSLQLPNYLQIHTCIHSYVKAYHLLLDAHAQFKRSSLPQLRGFQKIPQRKSFGNTRT